MTPRQTVPTLPLGHASTPGLAVPQLGFGVWEVPDAEVDAAAGRALEVGYRHLDTARLYGNEAGIGRVLAASELPRDDVFVTTKVWNDDHDDVRGAFDASMGRLGLDVLDLYLIHWPAPKQDRYVAAWRSMLELQQEGRVRSVGVCNFQVPHLQRLLDETGVLPSVNQVELSPYLQQRELRAFHEEHGIVTEAWSPLGQGGEILQDSTIGAIANNQGRTPAQVILRWHLQIGNVTFPKSVTPERIRENIDVFDLELTDEEVKQIDELDRGQRLGPDPDTFG
jgi:2,5-diketo-D-gluconate reductase A